MEFNFFALGTYNSIQSSDEVMNQTVADFVINRIQEIDDRMSVYKETSDIVKITQQAGYGCVPIHSDTMKVIKTALWFYRHSDGAFDITVRPLMKLWNKEKKNMVIPVAEEIEYTKSRIDSSKIMLDLAAMEAGLDIDHGEIDLGGIAKGFAADEARKILREHKIKNAVINLGGNIVTMGHPVDGIKWKIGIQNPLEKSGVYAGTLESDGDTTVASGGKAPFFVKNRTGCHHLVDPKTGYPAHSSILSVTAVCERSIDAEALTTSLCVMGIEKGMELLNKVKAEAIFITEDNQIRITRGLQKRWTPTRQFEDSRILSVC